jgi:hypothetical protein
MSLYIGTSPKKVGHAKKIVLQQESILLIFLETLSGFLCNTKKEKRNTNIDHHMGGLDRKGFVVHYFLYFIIKDMGCQLH